MNESDTKIDLGKLLGDSVLPHKMEVAIAPRPKKIVEFDLYVGESEYDQKTTRAFLNVLSFDYFYEYEGATVVINDMGEVFKVENTVEYILEALND